MKAFIIINGKSVRVIEKPTLDEAKETVERTCDFSQEVIIREIDLDGFKAYLKGRKL